MHIYPRFVVNRVHLSRHHILDARTHIHISHPHWHIVYKPEHIKPIFLNVSELMLIYKGKLILHRWHIWDKSDHREIQSPPATTPIWWITPTIKKKNKKRKNLWKSSATHSSGQKMGLWREGYGTWMVKTTCFLDMLAALRLHWLLLFNIFVPAHPWFSINKHTFTLHSNSL